MIVLVDDEVFMLENLRQILAEEGYSVVTFTNVAETLVWLDSEEPDLVISDIMMPDMDGFAFKKAHDTRFPHRLTPFIFLSSLSDPPTIVQGLDLGINDYLLKPVQGDILKAKIRSHLAMKERYNSPCFQGDLEQFPFVRIMKFCETAKFSGTVSVISSNIELSVEFRGGLPIQGEHTVDIDCLFGLSAGVFTIRAKPVDYQEFAQKARKKAVASGVTSFGTEQSSEKPMGRLSGLRLNNRLFQLQTEFVTYPDPRIKSVVILDGKVIRSRTSDRIYDFNRTGLEKSIEQQHSVMEEMLREKIAALIDKTEDVSHSPQQKADVLFDEGLERYRKQDYAGAIAAWEDALSYTPADRLLEFNIGLARKKMTEAGDHVLESENG